MRSLKKLCNDRGFPEVQRKTFRKEVKALLKEGGEGIAGALFCLRRLWRCYDAGGHSMGRSLRSCILEKILELFRENEKAANEACIQKAKILLSVLVAMHYDYEYINRRGWFDYRLKDTGWLPLSDREFVSAAAFALGVDEIPTLDEWPDDRIFAFIRGC